MKHYQNPFKTLTRLEWGIWLCSLCCITISFFCVPKQNYMTLLASLIGVTSLIFLSKGDPLGQMLSVAFSLLYSIVSLSYRYYGEMITYLCMTAPMAVLAALSWFRNPYEEGKNEVQVSAVSSKQVVFLMAGAAAATTLFYFILKYFHTANLGLSTLSIATSFVASMLTFFRSPYYALAYGLNDVVLILLWSLATKENSTYFPMIVCFAIFFGNDCYGFYNWRNIRKRQAANAEKTL